MSLTASVSWWDTVHPQVTADVGISQGQGSGHSCGCTPKSLPEVQPLTNAELGVTPAERTPAPGAAPCASRTSLTEPTQFRRNPVSSGFVERGSGPARRCQRGRLCPGTGRNRDQGRPQLVLPSVTLTLGNRGKPSLLNTVIGGCSVLPGTGNTSACKTDGDPCSPGAGIQRGISA